VLASALDDHLPFESELIDRLAWLVRLRWLAVVGAGLVTAAGAFFFAGELALGPLLAIIGTIAGYNLLFVFYLRALTLGQASQLRLRQATSFAQAQILVDLVALAALIHFSGGVENPLAFFFVFHVIIASILLRRAVSYLVAGLATLFLVAIAGLEQAGLLRHYHLPLLSAKLYQDPAYVLFFVGTVAFTLFLVAYLATSIAAKLRERDGALFESHMTCQARSAELEALNEQLRRVDAERTRLTMLVTHELRAPISIIYSALDLALGGYATPEKTHEILGRAQKRAGELLDLISDLLDLTRLREPKTRQQPAAPIQIDSLLEEVVAFVRPEAEEKGLSLLLEIAPGLPPVRVPADQAKLVWTNLLSNAIKYSERGDRIRASLRQQGSRVVGEVSDTGIGIAPEDLPRIFDEFFRASNARAMSQLGTGVGLSIVQRIVESHGGEIQVESELGQGTTFRFALPQADEPEG
jgi:signal transduction histidine kinase